MPGNGFSVGPELFFQLNPVRRIALTIRKSGEEVGRARISWLFITVPDYKNPGTIWGVRKISVTPLLMGIALLEKW